MTLHVNFENYWHEFILIEIILKIYSNEYYYSLINLKVIDKNNNHLGFIKM